jgi:putative phosphoesterase
MIAVVSDSHVPDRSPEIPEEFHEVMERADKVVHCGDFETRDVYEELDQKHDLIAVKGNCDFFELPQSQKFDYNDLKFGVYHGTGITPRGHRPTLADIAENKLEVDVLLNGHTHQQEAVEHEGSILLNPGSCTGVGGGSARRGNPEMMVFRVEEKLEVEMLTLEDGEILREEKEFEI